MDYILIKENVNLYDTCCVFISCGYLCINQNFIQIEVNFSQSKHLAYFPLLVIGFYSFSVFGEGVQECSMKLVSGKLLFSKYISDICSLDFHHQVDTFF